MEDYVDEVAAEHLEGVQNRGTYIYSRCPFHDERNPSFWVDRSDGHWACWTCGVRGTDLLELLEALGVGTRKAKAELEILREESKKKATANKAKREKRARKSFTGTHILPARELLPIFDFTPVELVDEGFHEDVLARHQIGYDRKHEKITFPLFDIEGNLIGISGRRADNVRGPKYKFYEGWHDNRDGIRVPGELGDWYPTYSSEGIRDHLWRGQYVFDKIYNGRDDELVVVEGYKAAMWMVQLGWENTVAIKGSSMTGPQERLIRRMGTPTWILLDANFAGRRGSRDICWRLGNASFPVYECNYDSVEFDDPVGERDESDLQPDDLDEEDIDKVLISAKRAARKGRVRDGNSSVRTPRRKAPSKRKLPRARRVRKPL